MSVFYEWQMISADENRYVEYFDNLNELSEMVSNIKKEHNPNFKYSIRLVRWCNSEGRTDEFYIENNNLMKFGDYGFKCPKKYLKELDNYEHLKMEGGAK